MSFGGKSFFEMIVIGTSVMRPIGSKSVSALYGSVRYSEGAVECPMW